MVTQHGAQLDLDGFFERERIQSAIKIFQGCDWLFTSGCAGFEPRKGRGGRIVIGMLCYALYANMLYLSRAWLADGSLPPAIGLWWAHGLVLLGALLLLRRQGRMVGGG